MKKNFLLDTNVLLHDPEAIHKFDDHNVIIPIYVIEEIDTFKKDMNELGRNAREISRLLDRYRADGNLGTGITLPGGGTLRVLFNTAKFNADVLSPDKKDNLILGVALKVREDDPGSPCIVISKDVNLRLRARRARAAGGELRGAQRHALRGLHGPLRAPLVRRAHQRDARRSGRHRDRRRHRRGRHDRQRARLGLRAQSGPLLSKRVRAPEEPREQPDRLRASERDARRGALRARRADAAAPRSGLGDQGAQQRASLRARRALRRLDLARDPRRQSGHREDTARDRRRAAQGHRRAKDAEGPRRPARDPARARHWILARHIGRKNSGHGCSRSSTTSSS